MRRHFFLSLLAVTAWIGAPSGLHADEVAELTRRGVEAMNRQAYADAVPLLERAFTLDPGREPIKTNLILCLHHASEGEAKDGRWAQAIDFEKRALTLDPDNRLLRRNLLIFMNNLAIQLSGRRKHEEAIEVLREGLTFEPENELATQNMAILHLEWGKQHKQEGLYTRAMFALEAGTQYDPSNWMLYVELGELAYLQNNWTLVDHYWSKALELNPGLEAIRRRLAKAQKERQVEATFRSIKVEHFEIRFEGGYHETFARLVGAYLDEAYRKVGQDFQRFPKAPIPVLIYTSEQFSEVTDKPDWVLGLYDGKIRVRMNPSRTTVEEKLRRILHHEYTHAVLFQLYGETLPHWINEGLAQCEEPGDTFDPAEWDVIREILQGRRYPIDQLDRYFTPESSSNLEQTFAYVQSRLMVQYLLHRFGQDVVANVLEDFGEGRAFEDILSQRFNLTPARFEQDWVAFAQERSRADHR